MSSSRISQVLLLAAVAYFVLLEAKIDVYVKDPHKTPTSSDDDRSNVVLDANALQKHQNDDDGSRRPAIQNENPKNPTASSSSSSSSLSSSSEQNSGEKRHRLVLVQHEVNGSKKHLLLKVRGHRLVEVYRERDGKKGHKKHLLLKINTPNHRHKYVRDEIVKSRENDSAEKKVSVRVNTSREDDKIIKIRENASAEKKVSVGVNTSREGDKIIKNRENASAEKKVSVRVNTSREVEAHKNDD